MQAFFEAQRPHNGSTYEEYLADWQAEVSGGVTADMSKRERKIFHYTAYNVDRSEHVHAAYTPSDALRRALQSIETPQLWMVLTEPWCGDSAYNLPVVAEAAACTDAVTLRILPRDENLDIMDQYLTEGGRSIPKLVAFGLDGQELFTWGPRPAPLQAYRQQLIQEGVAGREVVQHLIDRYEDGAWRTVDEELAQALVSAAPVSS